MGSATGKKCGSGAGAEKTRAIKNQGGGFTKKLTLLDLISWPEKPSSKNNTLGPEITQGWIYKDIST